MRWKRMPAMFFCVHTWRNVAFCSASEKNGSKAAIHHLGSVAGRWEQLRTNKFHFFSCHINGKSNSHRIQSSSFTYRHWEENYFLILTSCRGGWILTRVWLSSISRPLLHVERRICQRGLKAFQWLRVELSPSSAISPCGAACFVLPPQPRLFSNLINLPENMKISPIIPQHGSFPSEPMLHVYMLDGYPYGVEGQKMYINIQLVNSFTLMSSTCRESRWLDNLFRAVSRFRSKSSSHSVLLTFWNSLLSRASFWQITFITCYALT